MIVKVNYHQDTVTHSAHTSPTNWGRIQDFIEFVNGELRLGLKEFGRDSDHFKHSGYEFDGCTCPDLPQAYMSYYIHDVTLTK